MPVMLIICFRLPMLFGGTVIIEKVFNWPGMGQILIDSITANDYPVVMIITFFTTTMVLLASFILDLLTALLDPKIRFE